jgi:hypothetical protein
MQLAAVARPGGLVFLDQVVQHVLATYGREDDVTDDAIGMLD